MSVIQRNVTRTVLNATETTSYTKSPSADELTFELDVADNFYIGYKNRFASRYFHFSTLNATARTITVQYWDGTAWDAVEDFVDQTAGFTKSGFLSWVNVSGWNSYALTPIDDKDLYWIKITVNGALDAGTKLQSVLNLFCDENMARVYYPEMISDTRYLPPGRTDYLEQLEAATNLVALRLKQHHIIEDISQVIDINEVAISAVHAFAYVLLNPIAKDESEKESRDEAEINMNKELNRVKLDLDWDKSGVIETNEQNTGNIFIARS